MTDRMQIRLISLMEEAGNSFEQLETLANRTLREIPADQVDSVEIRPVDREVVITEESGASTDVDHVVFIKYRAAEEEIDY